jgi:hypothetical protein
MASRVPGSRKSAPPLPNWAAVRERIREEHRLNLPETDTARAIRQFRLAWEAVREAGLEDRTTGLIEQQARFSILRKTPSSDANG